MGDDYVKDSVEHGETILGIELGSTCIKSVLIDKENQIIASGSYEWENKWINGIWTYSLEDIWKGVRGSYTDLRLNVKAKYGIDLRDVSAIGISAMQHGYMVFDKGNNLLVPFRTWRNTITAEASQILSQLFDYPIPQRWSIAHLYQAILNHEEHVPYISYLTTLAGYVHWKLTGNKVVGLNEASGMFPIDTSTQRFDLGLINKFNVLIENEAYPWKLENILPNILNVGECAGRLTKQGAKLLDETGMLSEGIPFCPPEGDGATGMVATNSIKPCTGHVSAGTSIFAMFVLEKKLSKVHPEIDQVMTPDGHLVGMVHCNNCTSDLNAWISIFSEFAETIGVQIDRDKLFQVLFQKAMEGAPDGGGLLAYNYISGEHVTNLSEGRPLFVRSKESTFNLSNFMRTNLYSSLATLKIGTDILIKKEGVRVNTIIGHGGFFKTEKVGQEMLADALQIPVKVMSTATKGGPWGIAILASYMLNKKEDECLSDFLDNRVFSNEFGTTIYPDSAGSIGFDVFIKRYQRGLDIEKKAVEKME